MQASPKQCWSPFPITWEEMEELFKKLILRVFILTIVMKPCRIKSNSICYSDTEQHFASSRSPGSFQEELLSLCFNDQEWCLLDNELYYPETSGLSQVNLALLRYLIFLAGLLWVTYPAWVGECWSWVLSFLSNSGTSYRIYIQAAGKLSFPSPATLTLT